MKFLAALVHAAAAASSQAGAGPLELVFDSLAPQDPLATDPLDTGEIISKYELAGVQFRSPPAAEGCETASGSGDIDCTLGLKLEFVNFTIRTIHIPTNASMWLEADLCPSAEGVPTCITSNTSARIPIQEFTEEVTFQWTPASPIELKPNTTYSFTVFSNGETINESPIWLNGAKEFTTKNDPNADVRLAYTFYPGNEWWPRHLRDGRKVPSLQVYTS
ncbi:hypothetical protein DYB26_008536 [Aphanomyces astaci]|uniref:Uncharacterized protein n=1 Tax=Aphanomyces astaci TaxID=112090 RepID=A0A397FG11_APHAT|nr:hypothetical protein DYB36_011379 [Aphanomyces astaci]RHZ14195.1 hypothetical protein DYB26_008536 [Aphanomyces astaci]RHZ24108.1 hypothetical protein DYB31_009830 [Aphanomyces astaci]